MKQWPAMPMCVISQKSLTLIMPSSMGKKIMEEEEESESMFGYYDARWKEEEERLWRKRAIKWKHIYMWKSSSRLQWLSHPPKRQRLQYSLCEGESLSEAGCGLCVWLEAYVLRESCQKKKKSLYCKHVYLTMRRKAKPLYSSNGSWGERKRMEEWQWQWGMYCLWGKEGSLPLVNPGCLLYLWGKQPCHEGETIIPERTNLCLSQCSSEKAWQHGGGGGEGEADKPGNEAGRGTCSEKPMSEKAWQWLVT